jgi:hypothetical protein
MYTEAPDQVLRLSLEGAEFALKISGTVAKNLAAALYAVLKDQKRTKGKARITTMLRQQRPLTIYTIKKEDCPSFAKQAKEYGILYAPIPVKKGDNTLDIMVFQDDAARVNRIVERLDMAVLDTAAIESDIQQTRGERGPFPERTERVSPSESISASSRRSERDFSERPSVRQELKFLQKERASVPKRTRKQPGRDDR